LCPVFTLPLPTTFNNIGRKLTIWTTIIWIKKNVVRR
jgi:hypothetical protein